MKKNLILIFFLVSWVGGLCSQSILYDAVVPQGAVSEFEDMSLQWTIGEVFVHTVNHEDGILTQGSHQPLLQVELLNTLDNTDTQNDYNGLDIQVYPNPVEAIIRINLSSTQKEELDISLVDSSGKKLIQGSGSAASNQLEMDVSAFTAGMYFLHFKSKDGELIWTFKVIKN